MTLEIYPSTDQESMLSWNIANLPHIGDGNEHDWKMRLVSQWSNTDLIDLPVVGYLNILLMIDIPELLFRHSFKILHYVM